MRSNRTDRSEGLKSNDFSMGQPVDNLSEQEDALAESSILGHSLSASQETLICRLFDGELGFWGRWRAERLIRRSDEAQQFLCSLEESRNTLAEAVSVRDATRQLSQTESQALWKRIDAQLNQSAYEQLLSRRNVRSFPSISRPDRTSALPEWMRGLAWGGAGAAISAAVVLFTVAPQSVQNELPTSQAPQQLAQSGVSGLSIARSDVELTNSDRTTSAQFPAVLPSVREVSARESLVSSGVDSASASYERNLSDAIAAALAERSRRDAASRRTYMTVNRKPSSRSDSVLTSSQQEVAYRSPRAIEVDWMRSKGRVRVFHDPIEKAAYIWVKPGRASFPGVSVADPSAGNQRLTQLASSSSLAPSVMSPSSMLVEAVR